MKVKVLIQQPEYVDHTLTAGQRFRFAPSSNRPCTTDQEVMAVEMVVGDLQFSCEKVKLGWTPLTGKDAGTIYKFLDTDTLILSPRSPTRRQTTRTVD
jgi:hypothetical protein